MTKYIDLSHFFEDAMPGFKLKNQDGSFTQYTAQIYPFMTHNQTKPLFNGQAEFEITQINFQTSVGTYLDSPFHRHKDMEDISKIDISQTIKEGIVVDVRNRTPWETITKEDIPNVEISNKAVLFNFGWDQYWRTEAYYSYPFISIDVINYLIEQKVGIVGVDTVNIDSSKDLTRPAHTKLLKNRILIVENLTNLIFLYEKKFTFYSVPIKAKNTAAMPVRAFGAIDE